MAAYTFPVMSRKIGNHNFGGSRTIDSEIKTEKQVVQSFQQTISNMRVPQRLRVEIYFQQNHKKPT